MTSWKVPLTEVSVLEPEIDAVVATMRSGWLTMGPRTQELEEDFAAFMGTKHAIAVASGGAALHLLCAAAGVGPGDEVIVPAMSFIADASAVVHCGGVPVIADSRSLADPSIDPADVERRLTPQTRAVIAVHMFGYSADVEALGAICRSQGIALIEDACQASGAMLPGGARAGTAGAAGCFSFFSKSRLGAGEGGIVVTDDDGIEAKVRSLRSHAMTSVTWDRHRGHAETYDVPDLGFNYRIDETRATLAHARMGRLDSELEDLRRIVPAYRDRLEALEGVEVPFEDAAVARSGHFAFPILVADGLLRNRVREHLHAARIQTTFYPALTQLTWLRPHSPDGDCPVAEEFADRHLALPLFPGLDEARIGAVVDAIEAALAAG
jgi:dTDP-4-amino-4,6-dideoxygalactose transaminase